MAVKKVWLRKKLKRLRKKVQARNMEKNIKDYNITINVSGVSMEGESNINEHNRTSGEDKGKSFKEKVGNSREDDTRESN